MNIARSLVTKKMTILDMGCGSGWLVRTLRAGGFDAIGIDSSLEETSTSDYLLRRSAYETGFEDNTFDCILCLETIEHFEPRVYSEIKRIAKDGALLLIITPRKKWNWLGELLSRLGLSSPLVTPHINCVGPKDLPFELKESHSFMVIEWYGIYAIHK